MKVFDRIFISLDLPEELKDSLAGLQSGVPSVRWTEKENLHITLRFIGKMSEVELDSLLAELEILQELLPVFADLGAPVQILQKSNRSLIALPVSVNRELTDIVRSTNQILTGMNFAKDKKNFFPHVTLGRLKKGFDVRTNDYLTTCSQIDFKNYCFNQITVYSSELSPEGPRYFPLACYRGEEE